MTTLLFVGVILTLMAFCYPVCAERFKAPGIMILPLLTLPFLIVTPFAGMLAAVVGAAFAGGIIYDHMKQSSHYGLMFLALASALIYPQMNGVTILVVSKTLELHFHFVTLFLAGLLLLTASRVEGDRYRSFLSVRSMDVIMIGVLMLVIALVFGAATGGIAYTPSVKNIEAIGWLTLVTHGVATAIIEESFFRAHLIPLLLRYMSPPVVVGLSALLFGLAHLHFGYLWVMGGMLAGIGYALIYLRGGILLVITAHAVMVVGLEVIFRV